MAWWNVQAKRLKIWHVLRIRKPTWLFFTKFFPLCAILFLSLRLNYVKMKNKKFIGFCKRKKKNGKFRRISLEQYFKYKALISVQNFRVPKFPISGASYLSLSSVISSNSNACWQILTCYWKILHLFSRWFFSNVA